MPLVPIKVTARLCSPLTTAVPPLDSLLVAAAAGLRTEARRLDRNMPCPPSWNVGVPLGRKSIGGHTVAQASSAIYRVVREWHEHVTTGFPAHRADEMRPDRRLRLNTTGGDYKDYRLPVRCRSLFDDLVVWFAVGDRREVERLLRRVHAIGRKRSIGYGRVAAWTVEEWGADLSWFVRDGRGRSHLMRPLPDCADLPEDMAGYRWDFGAVESPYFHPDRFIETVVPC